MAIHNHQRKKTFAFYRRLPEAFDSATISPQDWLVNNGNTYVHAATILATSVEDAYRALQEKRAGHGRKARFVHVSQHPHLQRLQAPGPGDVLVEEERAWMIRSDHRLEDIPYEVSLPWRSYARSAFQSHQIHRLSWSPDGAYLAASTGDGGNQVRLHLITGGKTRSRTSTSYHWHGNWPVYAVAWSPDGSRLASGGYEGEVHVWRPDPRRGYGRAARGSILVCRVERLPESPIGCLAWTPDSRRVLAGRADGGIVQWHAVTGALLFHTARHQRDVTALALSPDGLRFASASKDATVRIWRQQDAPEADIVYRGHRHEVLTVAWSPDGTQVVSAGTRDRYLHLWNPQTGELQGQIPLSISFPGPLSILSVAWSPAGRLLAAGCDDGTIQIIEMEQKQHLFSYRTEKRSGVKTVTWSPDGWLVASGAYDRQSGTHAVEVWQASNDVVMRY